MNKLISKIENKIFWARHDFYFWRLSLQMNLSTKIKIFKIDMKMFWKCVILGIPKMLISEAALLKGKITGKYLPGVPVEVIKQSRKELLDLENVVGDSHNMPLIYRLICNRCMYLAKTMIDNELVNRAIAA